MLRGIGRFIVATAAGAGLGAGAGLLRRRAMHAHEHPDGPGDFVGPSSDEHGTESVFAPDGPVTVVRPGSAAAPAEPSAPEEASAAPQPAPTPPPHIADTPGPTPSEIDALTAQVADLEEARNRLRRRAAMLRAEMEGTPDP